MKILSIDVGMKNLAYCLLNYEDDYTIEKWDIIDLCENTTHICKGKLKNGERCSKIGKYTKKNEFYCKTHAKKYKVPPPSFSNKKIKKLKKDKLISLANVYDISFNIKEKKENILKHILLDLSNNYYDFVGSVLTTEMNMVSYGINLKKLFHKTFSNIDINLVIIENQIGPLALRMKTLQGMIMQHFIENNINNVVPVNSNNKLKDFLGKKKTSYAERKKESVKITRQLIQNSNWNDHFEKHKKKDDLADCFLQAKWYISHKLNN
jgi:hypothetical protein|tara:strand:- start:2001 stop:2795 length:795 start_codon:yes stop_codon:yes gene_type:complete